MIRAMRSCLLAFAGAETDALARMSLSSTTLRDLLWVSEAVRLRRIEYWLDLQLWFHCGVNEPQPWHKNRKIRGSHGVIKGASHVKASLVKKRSLTRLLSWSWTLTMATHLQIIDQMLVRMYQPLRLHWTWNDHTEPIDGLWAHYQLNVSILQGDPPAMPWHWTVGWCQRPHCKNEQADLFNIT